MLPLLWNGPGFVPCLLMLHLSMFSTWNAPLGTTKMPLIERPKSLPTHPRGSGYKTGTAAHIKPLTCLTVGWNLCYLHEPHQCSSWGRQVRFPSLKKFEFNFIRNVLAAASRKALWCFNRSKSLHHMQRDLKSPGERGHCVMIVICGCFSPFTRFI